MEKYLEKIMNFINENTMLLIIICIFLIVILVIYLIDNTIKSKKLEKAELENKGNEEPKVLNNSIPKEEVPAVEEVAPVVPEVVPVVEEKVETTVVEPAVEEPSVTVEEPKAETSPIVDTSIEELLNKDYSSNNTVVDNIPEEVVSTPIEEKPKNKYSNDKKLSDIFGKKEEKVESKIENTKDFSDELDRILKKLNEEEARIDNTSIEETSDYTNMF